MKTLKEYKGLKENDIIYIVSRYDIIEVQIVCFVEDDNNGIWIKHKNGTINFNLIHRTKAEAQLIVEQNKKLYKKYMV